ncbi:MAG: alginate lyase family protein [Hyphomicrobiaceae bacterium]
MVVHAYLSRLRRGLRKPPRYIAERIIREARSQAERQLSPLRIARATPLALARREGHADVDAWWDAVGLRPSLTASRITRADLDRICPGDSAAIFAAAERALAHEVDLLGSGPVQLGEHIDWHRDFKTGHRWPAAYCKAIEYNNLDQPSDVKVPWELSRMQWLVPAGQAYALSGEDRYAAAVRDVIDDWIAENPYANSINWACTMDVALRLITWSWLFHVFKASAAWSDRAFRARFLQSLYLHGDFTARHLEKSDVNGNHYTADAAGLVFAGMFFGGEGEPARWTDLGWRILGEELPRQVFADGVDFEASVPYHRLVQELFLLPALYRLRLGLEVPRAYRDRLCAMASFTAAYSRADGSVPYWGDADDARTLPFRAQPINDHRYLVGIVGCAFDAPELLEQFSGPRSELFWLLGADAASSLPDRDRPPAGVQCSSAFTEGGFYVLRSDRDHVFVDCGPVGLAGRGGHGHNDLLSFEAVLDGAHLVTDCGAYLYTADFKSRNAFRSTAYHNTPRIDGEEINRFFGPRDLWTLRNDARHRVDEVSFTETHSRLVAGHSGYERLSSPVRVSRTFELDHERHRLTIHDDFSGAGVHTIEMPLHLSPGVTAALEATRVRLTAGNRAFVVTWSDASDWQASIEPARVSPSYGVVVPSERLVFRRADVLRPLTVTIEPA